MKWHERQAIRVQHREATAEYLQTLPWDYFYTITNRSQRKDDLPFMKYVYNEFKSNGVCRAFVAVEPHESCSGLHSHGLLYSAFLHGLGTSANSYRDGELVAYEDKVDPKVLANLLWSSVFERFGRSKVEVIKSNEAVTRYCAKYITHF